MADLTQTQLQSMDDSDLIDFAKRQGDALSQEMAHRLEEANDAYPFITNEDQPHEH